jgi:Cd2+/Zn2+-exporting ATPase
LELEEEIGKIKGVERASVDFMAQKVRVVCDAQTLEKVKDCCNHFEEVKVIGVEGAAAQPKGDKSGKKIQIENLCCANCARELEEELKKIDGVEATVDFMQMTVLLKTDSTEAYNKAIYTISHFEDVRIVDKTAKKPQSVWRENLVELIGIAISVVFFIPALVITLLELQGAAQIISYVCFGISYIAVGWKVLVATAKNIAKGKIFDENFLMTIASIGAIALGIITGDGFTEGVAVMLLYQIGEVLQSVAVGSSRRSIATLMDLKSETATLLKDGKQVVVDPEELEPDDIILIKAGEKVPVDGVVVEGETSLDMKSLNGEAVPREVKEGDEILSGSINVSKVIKVKVLRAYKNSAVAKILELVENSTATKAKPEKFITKFAKYYTPIVCILALAVAALVPTIICAVQGAFTGAMYLSWIYRALGLLVISCPCAVVISVPLTYFSGIGRSAKFGILIKGSTCLDELAQVTVAAFDKTGTLTEGTFEITNSTSKQALELAAAAEKFSSHPIAVAFANVPTSYQIASAEELAGRGVKAEVEGEVLLVGNAKLLKENKVAFEAVKSVSTIIYVALGGKYLGYIEIDDRIKADAKESLADLKKQGVTHLTMLTGDSEGRAQKVASSLALDSVQAGLLPDEKLDKAVELKKQGKLLYVGDGINDAPVMTVADCAVSMGKVGSDAAIEASDVVLVSDNLALLGKGKKIAKGTRRIVFENIIGSILVKVAIMVMDLAIPNFPLIVAVVGDVGVMLLAVLNALRTRLIK